MEVNTQLATANNTAQALSPYLKPAEGEPSPMDRLELPPPVRWIHQALRGRYRWVVALGAIASALGGWLGNSLGRPQYRSEGLIRIAYTRPAVMQETDLSQPMAMFEAFLQSQVQVLTSRRLLDAALRDPAWKSSKVTPPPIDSFSDGLKVTHPGGSEQLSVVFMAEDPVVAAVAVESLIHAYSEQYANHDNRVQRQRLLVLEERRKELGEQFKAIQEQIRGIAQEFGSVTFDQLYDAAVHRVTKFEGQLADIRLALAMAQRPEATPQTYGSLTAEQIATMDATMQEYVAERSRLERNLEQLRLRGYLDGHPDVVLLTRSLDRCNQRIREYAIRFRPANSVGAAIAGRGTGMTLMDLPPESLKDAEKAVNQLYEQARAEMVALGTKRLQIERLRSEGERVRVEMNDVARRAEILQVESSLGDRLDVLSSGEIPIAPFKDNRQRMTLAGIAGGAVLPAAVFVLVGLLRPRYRFSDEAESAIPNRPPLLGILPWLPDVMENTEQFASAAQCVHQIRVMMQVGKKPDAHSIHMITSASPGEGKTSLVAALGLSFAASGSRTLLIDCDLIGQRLSQGFKMEKSVGLHQALVAGQIDGCLQRTSTPGLWVLPAGQTDMLYACTLSSTSLKQVLDDARAQFDVVLIDTGPILGSVEAAVVAPLTDGVVMTVARDQQRPLVHRSLQQLRSLGATVAGVVFNRAEPRDFYRSVHGSSLRSVNAQRPANSEWVPVETEPCALGPVVRSVASFLPSSN